MLTTLILKTFVPGFGKSLAPAERVRCGIVSGITGIVCNVLLAVLKVILAIVSGSIAVAADAVNNLSDAGSSVISWISCMLAARPADREDAREDWALLLLDENQADGIVFMLAD